MRLLTDGQRRRPAGIHDHQAAAGLKALKAGMGRVGERRPARVVIGQDGGEEVGLGRAHAVEQREIAVAMPEEAQHRHHAVDGIEQGLRRRHVARGERGAQRQEIHQQFDQRAGIAADMSAVGQDLPRQLIGQPLGRAANMTLLTGHAQGRVAERNRRLQPRHAVTRVRCDVPQMPDLAGQAAQEPAIEAHVGNRRAPAAPGSARK